MQHMQCASLNFLMATERTQNSMCALKQAEDYIVNLTKYAQQDEVSLCKLQYIPLGDSKWECSLFVVEMHLSIVSTVISISLMVSIEFIPHNHCVWGTMC